jgi:uridine kinase
LVANDVRQILDAVSGARPVILIDGRSGSGKTEMAVELVAALDSQFVSLDDVYPGWDGLEAASGMVRTDILLANRFQCWDWQADAPGDWCDLNPGLALVVEGSGALSRANRELATLGVWVELDEPTRKARALERDGEMYAPHWDRWAAQEQRFFDRERPDLLADLVIAGGQL